MATAASYDTWEDPGVAFGEDEIRGYVVSAVAEGRVRWLLHTAVVIEKLLALPDAPKRQWWTKAQGKMVDCTTWYCIVAGLEGIDRSSVRTLPDPSSAEGKSLASEALKMESGEFMAQWIAEARAALISHVTIGRRCASARKMSGWTKKETSMSNKVANALVKELDVALVLSTLLSSLSAD